MKLQNYSIGNSNIIQFNFSIFQKKENLDPEGYFELIIQNEVFGNKSVYTYLGIIEDQLLKFVNNKKSLKNEIFENKSDEEIFNLFYLLNDDWEYSENLPIEQLIINNEFCYPFKWVTEESMDEEYIIVFYDQGDYILYGKHNKNNQKISSEKLFVLRINESLFEKMIQEFSEILHRNENF